MSRIAGANGRESRAEKKLRKLLISAEEGFDPFTYARFQNYFFKASRPEIKKPLYVANMTVTPRTGSDSSDIIDIDLEIRHDERNRPRFKGSFVHYIALTLKVEEGQKPTVQAVAGVVGREGSRHPNQLNIPDSLTFINKSLLERDLAYVRLRLKKDPDFLEGLDEQVRQAMISGIKKFIKTDTALKFPQIIPAVKAPQPETPSPSLAQ